MAVSMPLPIAHQFMVFEFRVEGFFLHQGLDDDLQRGQVFALLLQTLDIPFETGGLYYLQRQLFRIPTFK